MERSAEPVTAAGLDRTPRPSLLQGLLDVESDDRGHRPPARNLLID
ncbi:hypothetical protein [Pseudonocardia sp. H11422]|nr:hypothetical protein [Pseudonocardia sp. H11422]